MIRVLYSEYLIEFSSFETMLCLQVGVLPHQLPQPGVGVLAGEVVALEGVIALEDHHYPLGDRT